MNPNYEQLASLRPDLVIIQGQHKKVYSFCKSRGMRLLRVDMDSVATIKAGVMSLGAVLDARDKATSLCLEIDRDLAAIRADVATSKRPRVFISLTRQSGSLGSLYTCGGKSFLSELLSIVGGDNIFADASSPYMQASKEALVTRNPEVIVELRPGEKLSAATQRKLRADWQTLRSISAVKNDRIQFVTDDFLLLPGPRVAQTARALRRALVDAQTSGPKQ